MQTLVHECLHMCAFVRRTGMVYNGCGHRVCTGIIQVRGGRLMGVLTHGSDSVNIPVGLVHWRVDDDGLHLRGEHDDWCHVSDTDSLMNVLIGVSEYMVEHGQLSSIWYAVPTVLQDVGANVFSIAQWFKSENIVPYARPLLHSGVPQRWTWQHALRFTTTGMFDGWLNVYRGIGMRCLFMMVRLDPDNGAADDSALPKLPNIFIIGPLSMTGLMRELSSPSISMHGVQRYMLADELALIGNDAEPSNVFWEELETLFPGYHDYVNDDQWYCSPLN